MPTARLKLANPTAGNRTKGTISCWFKRSGLSSNQWIYSERKNSTDYAGVRINSGDTIGIFSYNGGSAEIDANTNAVFRDTSAWYHFVANWDTSLATASDRVKIWINGELQSFSGSPSYPSQSSNTKFGLGSTDYPITIGRRGDDAEYFDGSMAHYHRVDNQTLAPTVFGETDSTTGIWKPITSPSITYTGSASHNFFLDFASSSDMGNDISGNNNDFTVNGTMTQTIDTPSNVFATLNPLAYRLDAGVSLPTYSNGNTTVSYASDGGAGKSSMATLCFTSGKWYWEYKVNSANDTVFGGITRADYDPNDNFAGRSIYYNKTGALSVGTGTGGTANGSYGNSYTTGDIISVAFDCDNGVIWFAKNGTWQNSATQAEIEAGTTTNSATTGITLNQFWSPFLEGADSGMSINFGNGYFGTTAVASAGTNSGIGTFEYDVPSGYKALCTKNINAEEYS